MSGRTSQGGRSNLSSSSRTGDGPAVRSSTASSSSSSARRRSGGGAGGARSSTSGKAGRSLQEISIPEGMDEEEESDGLDRKAKQLVLDSDFASMINDSDPDKFDRARLVEVLTAPYIEDTGGDIVALDPHALKKLFTTTIGLLQREWERGGGGGNGAGVEGGGGCGAGVGVDGVGGGGVGDDGGDVAQMSVDAERKRLEMAGATGAIEDAYRQGLTSHAARLNKVQDSLEGVEHRFGETAHKAVRIGDRLSRMEGQRARAAEAMDLLKYFEGFSEDQDTVVRYMKLLPAVFSDEDRRAEAATAYSDFLEQELLDLFERAAGRSPPEVELMRECSDILFALNEGDHLQSRFVFYVVTQELQRGDQDQSAASTGSLSGLFRRVVTVCQNQFAVIGQVFPPPLVAKVTRLLLQRILNDPVYGVQARVEQVLVPQPPMDPLPLADYLNCLCTVEQQTAALFGMLKAKHMFFDHRVGYPAKEKRHLLETLLLTSETVWEGMLHYSVAGQAVLVGLETFPTVRDEKVVSYHQLLSGPLRPSVCSTVFAGSAETIRRCRTIVVDEEEREQKVCEFFQVICRYLADHLLTPALRCANVLLPKPASNVASAALREMTGGDDQLPPKEFYEAAKAASRAAAALEEHYRDVVAQGMDQTPTIRTIASETKKSLLHRVDGWTVRVLQDALRLLVVYAEKQISLRSNKNDYCPKEDDADIDATKTVKAVSSVLTEQHSVFVDCLKEVDHRVDLTMMWEGVGLKVHQLFVEHIKRTKVNVNGAFILASDVNRLQEVLRSFGCAKVTSAAEQLREIVNLFVVPPENLLSLMQQGKLAEMPKEVW
eukprot:jgi/Undpi1/13394/HiC_scaffold_8.g03053.m1